MKKYSLLLVCMVISLVTMAQKPLIVFEEKSYDFGKVNEEEGKVTHVFEFVNKGNTPLVINRVQASCGCTTPVWTKDPIEPGKKGAINVTYAAAGRPGVFTKTITVYNNSAEEQLVLTIHGEVIPKAGSDNPSFPANFGGLRAKQKVVQLYNVDKGKTQTHALEIQNGTTAPLKVTVENLPPYLSYTVSPEVLKPAEEGKITFAFNSKKCAQWGPISNDVFVVLNGAKKFTEDFRLSVVGNVIEDFSKMTLEQKRKAPILEVPVRTINLGVMKQDGKRVAKFKISNKGQNPLEIRRFVNNNKELTIRQSKMSVASGRSADIVVTLNAKSLTEGDYKKYITIQTNDPDNATIILNMSWIVQK
jgi:Protein of unknown function (DUF1573).